MLMHGENGQGPFPWTLPLWQPDYAIFFGVLYAVILVLAIGLTLVFYRAIKDVKRPEAAGNVSSPENRE